MLASVDTLTYGISIDKRKSTCNDNDRSAEDIAEDEDVNVFKRVKLKAVATRNWWCHLDNLFPFFLPVLVQNTHGLNKTNCIRIFQDDFVRDTNRGFKARHTMVVYRSPVCVNSWDWSSSAWKRALKTPVSVSFKTLWRAFRSTRSVSWTPSMYWEAAWSKQFPSPVDRKRGKQDHIALAKR